MCLSKKCCKMLPTVSFIKECEQAATDCWLVMTRWRGREKRRKGEGRQNSKQKCELDR